MCQAGHKTLIGFFIAVTEDKTLIGFFIAVTEEGAAQPPQEGEENPQQPTEELAAKAVVGEAVIMPGTSGEVDLLDDPLGTADQNEDVDKYEDEEGKEEEEDNDDPDTMDEDEYLTKVINKPGKVR